jgi:methylated-DNA-[protein]-cysteine S-methyltransferase
MKPFALKVYGAVLTIPFGQTRSYKWVAQKIKQPKACRAVAQALKHNPYPLIIPCHRVINSDNESGGYVFGRAGKKLLLALEKEIHSCIKNKG